MSKVWHKFQWAHFEWYRSKLSSGVFHVERTPEKPWVKEYKIVDNINIPNMWLNVLTVALLTVSFAK